MTKIIIIILASVLFTPLTYSSANPVEVQQTIKIPDTDNQQFRDEIIQYVRDVAEKKAAPKSELDALDQKWANHYQKTDWSVVISLYHQGQVIGEGRSHRSLLSETLKTATTEALGKVGLNQLNQKQSNDYRFKVVFDYYPAKVYPFIEYHDQGLELTGSRVAIRTLDTHLIKEQIQSSIAYLLRSMHPELHGFFKFYNAGKDKHEELLRTIYSSSSLFTLIQWYEKTNDPAIKEKFKPIAQFILSNQVKDGPNAGGFYYGMTPKNNKRTCVLVVGTTSKTIFSLLLMNQIYQDDPVYLNAARKAGDWLLTMVNAEGRVRPIADCEKGGWEYNDKQSLLYSGQVLSALSRLYATTKDPRYYAAAEKIAKQFVTLIGSKGPLVGDEYRPPNSISTSWVMMSLIDFAKINSDPLYRNTIKKVGAKILARQLHDPSDIYSNGRYLDAMTASGNGWINEVLGVYYAFCEANQLGQCEKYKHAIVLTSRWLIQNAYSKENSYNVKNPANAIGGFITNFTTQTVRTDAVCHGVNSLIYLLRMVGDKEQTLLELPEKPLEQVLPLLRAGNGYL